MRWHPPRSVHRVKFPTGAADRHDVIRPDPVDCVVVSTPSNAGERYSSADPGPAGTWAEMDGGFLCREPAGVAVRPGGIAVDDETTGRPARRQAVGIERPMVSPDVRPFPLQPLGERLGVGLLVVGGAVVGDGQWSVTRGVLDILGDERLISVAEPTAQVGAVGPGLFRVRTLVGVHLMAPSISSHHGPAAERTIGTFDPRCATTGLHGLRVVSRSGTTKRCRWAHRNPDLRPCADGSG